MDAIRPKLELFSREQVDLIIGDAEEVIEKTGFFVENDEALALLGDSGIRIEGGRAFATRERVRSALASAPHRVALYDRDGGLAMDLSGDHVHFDPGSAALFYLDPRSGERRRPGTTDLKHLAWVTESCRHIAGQSTAMVPCDVPEEISDRWRLYIALLNCRKPVITGTFRKDGFKVMREMLEAVRGGAVALREKPLAIFDCCPTPPLKWSDLTCQALIDCARSGIPAELISMPMCGASSPVTLREMVVQHCAESLSGVLIHQLACPGAPIIYGGSPTAFDMRHGTTPLGAVETMMVDVGYAQVGKRLGLPTHAYMGPSDSKSVDYQAGMEAGQALMLAALAGINMVSGPGMLDFENCQSLEKLVLDNEVCGMALRLVGGIGHSSASRAPALIGEVVNLGTFIGHPHTRENFRGELFFPGKSIDRGTHAEWEKAGCPAASAAARGVAEDIIARGNPAEAPQGLADDLGRIIQGEAERLGQSGRLPAG